MGIFYSNKQFDKLLHKSIRNYIVNKKLILLTLAFLITYRDKSYLTSLESNIGVNISFHIYKNHFSAKQDQKQMQLTPNTLFKTFEAFKTSFKMDNKFFVKLGDIFVETMVSSLNPVFERVFLDGKYVIRLNNKYFEEVKNSLIVSPQSLPMICKPLYWSEFEPGGFLLNRDEEYTKDLIVGSTNHNHKISKNALMIDSINYLNSLEFKVNKELINYLESDGRFILDSYSKSKSHLYINNSFALEIAKTYMNTPFYLNVNAD